MTFFRTAARRLAILPLVAVLLSIAGCGVGTPSSYKIGGPPKIQKLMSGSSWRGRDWVQVASVLDGKRVDNPVTWTFFSDGRGLDGGYDRDWRFVPPNHIVLFNPGASGESKDIQRMMQTTLEIRDGELWLSLHETLRRTPQAVPVALTWVVYGPLK